MLKGEEVIDPYTIVIDTQMYTMSKDPTHFQGFSQYMGDLDSKQFEEVQRTDLGEKLNWEDVPDKVKEGIQEKLL